MCFDIIIIIAAFNDFERFLHIYWSLHNVELCVQHFCVRLVSE